MRRASTGLALAAAIVIAALTAGITMAAPAFQDEPPTVTPSATATGFGPTPTPSPTLPAPPPGGGLVTVRELAVRLAPDESATPLGGLAYATVIYPIGRSANGNWAAINYQGSVGFVLGSLVLWHPDVDILELPVLIPPFLETPTFTTGTVAGGTLSPTDTPTQVPSSTSTPEPAAPESTATVEVAEIPDATETPVPAMIAPGDTPPTESIGEVPASGSSSSLPIASVLPWLLIGLPIVLLGFYGWQFMAGQRETRRYHDAFPLEYCPVCQSGTLSVDSVVRRSLGIARTTRTVRCDSCRSVLRQIAPGVWRYAIDPYTNPDLARDYDGRQFTDNELKVFMITASGYLPAGPEVSADTAPPLTDEEIMADLEARIPPPEEEPVIEEAPDLPDEAQEAAQEADSEDQTTA
jgi:hypothetical protein